ncbi:ribonuclease H-like domain-containing protein [Tanacetum coccineum]
MYFTRRWDIILEPTSKTISTVDSILQAGNPVKEILLKLNLPDHKSVLTDSKIYIKMDMDVPGSSKSQRFIATCSYSTNICKDIMKAKVHVSKTSATLILHVLLEVTKCSLLFLQNNDNSNAPIVNVKLAGFDNYKMWSTAMRIAERCNAIVLGWILRSLSSELYLGQVYSKIAAEVWDEFKETYDKIDGSMIFNVMHKIHGLKQGVLRHNQLVMLRQFLMGLNDVYQPFRSNLLAREPLPDVKEAFNIVSREKSYRGLHPSSGSNKAQRGASTSTGSTTFDNAFTKEQMMNILSLINKKPIGMLMPICMNLTVGHPSGTLAKITTIGNLRLSANIVLSDVLSESENSQLVSQSESELNLLNFFDNFDDTTLKSPNDDERDPSVGDGNVMASSDIDSSPLVNREATFATQLDETNNISKGSSVEMSGSRFGIESQSITNNGDEPQTVRKSSRVSNLPFKFNDFILPSNKKTIVHYFNRDVYNAFRVFGFYIEDVYMDLPPGYYDKSETKVCKLVKSLYGLKQAPRQWNEKLTCALKENGFEQSINDYSLFVKNCKGVFMVLLVYVDDIVITGNNTKEIEKFKLFLKSKFQIKDSGTLKYFLGIEVLENKNDLCLSKKYCLELLCDYGLLACKPPATPMQQNVSLSHGESEKDKKLKSLSGYQKLVGKLIYMSVICTSLFVSAHAFSFAVTFYYWDKSVEVFENVSWCRHLVLSWE